MLAGLVAGNGTAALVFYYDGTQPINVLPVLSVFVLLPLVLLLFLGMRAVLGKLIPLLFGRPGLAAITVAVVRGADGADPASPPAAVS